ncbi:hypothetical protein QE152_g7126 [Popillia japonica]|uniref:Uncharacterized protein n=1 Tax=Popillia japonica TaxID=7064 RepID=A0AAW1MEH3_POPJA
MTAPTSFINTKEFIEYENSGSAANSYLTYVKDFGKWDVTVGTHSISETKYCDNQPKPLTPYDTKNSHNVVKCYAGKTKACNLFRGYLIVNYKYDVLFGVALPLSDNTCYDRFSSRLTRRINLTGIIQYTYYSAFPKITTSYTCMVVAFSAIVVL